MGMLGPLHYLVIFLLLGALVLAALVAVVLLLANPRTRVVTLSLLGATGMVVVLLALGLVYTRTVPVPQPTSEVVHRDSDHRAVQTSSGGNSSETIDQFQTVMESYMAQQAKPAPKKPTSPTAEAPAKNEDDLSQAVATKTVGMLRAMARALGRALVEEEQMLAEKKDGTQPAGAAIAPKPAWVDAPPAVVGESYQMSIAVGPFTTRAECEANLPEALQRALDEYVDVAIGRKAVGLVRLPADSLRHDVSKEEWEETRPYSVGPMVRLHCRLQFDRSFKARVLEAYREALVGERLRVVGAWAAIGLSLLTLGFAYLKVDLATDGNYRRRLRLGAAAVILIGLIAAAVALVA